MNRTELDRALTEAEAELNAATRILEGIDAALLPYRRRQADSRQQVHQACIDGDAARGLQGWRPMTREEVAFIDAERTRMLDDTHELVERRHVADQAVRDMKRNFDDALYAVQRQNRRAQRAAPDAQRQATNAQQLSLW